MTTSARVWKIDWTCPKQKVPRSLRSNRDLTFAVTAGRWGGIWFMGNRSRWRLTIGFVAVTFMADEFLAMWRAYLDAVDAAATASTRERSEFPSSEAVR